MQDKIGKPAICYETGLDEAFLLGTKEELSGLAQTILKLLDAPDEAIDYYGVKTQSASQASLTHEMSEIGIDGLILVKSAADKRTLMNKIRVNNGEPPIDWESFDEIKG